MLSATRTFFCALFLIAPLGSLADSLTGRILDVHDGDTLTVQVPGDTQKYKIRMMGVDTPEVEFFNKSQGEAAFIARDYLRGLAPVGSAVTVLYDQNGFDKHNRILGRILVNNIEVNREMLKAGWGYLYFIAPFDKKLAAEYSDIARAAAENQQGLFAPRFIQTVQAPYDFRLTSRNQAGLNLVGDLETKILYHPADSSQVPVWRRVFFPEQDLALRLGYHWK